MFLVLTTDGTLRDAKESMRGVYIRAGKHEVKRILSPEKSGGLYWLVLIGTEIGAPEYVTKDSTPENPEKLILWGGMEASLEED